MQHLCTNVSLGCWECVNVILLYQFPKICVFIPFKKQSVGNFGSRQGEDSHGEGRQPQLPSLIYKKCIPESHNKVFSFPQFSEMQLNDYR